MVHEESSSAPRPAAALIDLIWGFKISQAIYVIARLSIVDLLRDGAKSAHELASTVGAHEPSLGRLLRALTTVGVLVEDDEGKFTATPLGELLRSDHPQSMRAMAIFQGSPFVWQPTGEIYGTILTGKPAFDERYGESFFDYLGHNPEEAAIFNAAMTSSSMDALPAVLAAYDFSGCTRIVDVGGGQGIFLRGILEQYPQATGVLCDLPTVLEETEELRNSAVADRCELVGADMFQSVPAGGDLYILKSILHDWNDEEALQILRNCREAIVDQGKILHIGTVLEPSNRPDFGRWLDFTMLVLLTGRERTEAEFRELYRAAGFELTRVIHTDGPTIVEGIAV